MHIDDSILPAVEKSNSLQLDFRACCWCVGWASGRRQNWKIKDSLVGGATRFSACFMRHCYCSMAFPGPRQVLEWHIFRLWSC